MTRNGTRAGLLSAAFALAIVLPAEAAPQRQPLRPVGSGGGLPRLVGGPASGRPAIRYQLTNPEIDRTPFLDCVSSGSVTVDAARERLDIEVRMSNLVENDGRTLVEDSDGAPCSGDEIICIVQSLNSASVDGLPTTIVFRGEVRGGTLSVGHDLCRESPTACPTFLISTFDTDIRCYAADRAFAPALFAAIPSSGDTGADCSVAGRCCEGLAPGHVQPASALVARDGITVGCP